MAEARVRKLEFELQELQLQLAQQGGPSSAPSGPANEKLEKELAETRRKLTQAEERLKATEQNVSIIGQQVRAEQDHAVLAARQETLEMSQRIQQLEEELQGLKLRQESERMHAEKLAYQDQLTGLPNLNLLLQALDLTMKRVRAKEHTAAVLLLDIDRYQSINRVVGYEVGNELLRMVGDRLRQRLPEGAVLGRRGEDEFIVIVSVPILKIENPVKPANAAVLARNLAQQLQAELAKPFTVQGQPLTLSVTVGISAAPADAGSASELLEHADSALHEAKESGRNRFLFYSQDMAAETERKISLENDLTKALELNEFQVLYQPIVEIPRGLMVGAAATLAWVHPSRGPQAPDDFLPVAERSGQIVGLGNWLVAEACEQARQLKSGFVTVKLSTRQLLDPGLPAALMRSITDSRIKPENLVLSISEGSLNDVPERFDAVVNQAAQWGIPFALTQSGAEPLLLRRLQSKPVRFLRLSRWVVEGIMHDENCAGLCKTLLAMARQLGLSTLAEGADTPAQVRFLAAHGCEYACGVYFKPPVTGEEILALKRQTWKV